MSSISISIGEVSGNVYIGSQPVSSVDILELSGVKVALAEQDAISEQVQAGADREALEDLGYSPEAASQVEIVKEEAPKKAAAAIALTPQTPEDQRTEIRNTSKRNRALVEVDENISAAHSAEGFRRQIQLGRKKSKVGRDAESFQVEADSYRSRARKKLKTACDGCEVVCQIRGNFDRWERMHKPAQGEGGANQESRDRWRKRLIVNPNASCVPPKKKS